MRLYMIRHGTALDRSSSLVSSDSQRPLTKEGDAEMRIHACALKRLGITFEVVMTSPLLRALQTGQIVCEILDCMDRLTTCDELGPGCRIGELASLLQKHGTAESVAVVGHNPDLEEMAAHLIGGAGSAIVFKKGGVCRIDIERLRPHPRGELIWHLSPKILRLLGT